MHVRRTGLTGKPLWQLVRKAGNAWLDDYAPSMGAALAYYTVSSLVPLFVFVLAVGGLVYDEQAARGQLVEYLHGTLGEGMAQTVEELLKSAPSPAHGLAASVLSALLLVIGATSAFTELQDVLDRIWHAPALTRTSGLRGLLHGRLRSFGLLVVVGLLLVISLFVSAALAAIGLSWGGSKGHWRFLLHAGNLLADVTIAAVLFAVIYRTLPRVRIAWYDVWIGAIVTAVLFTAGQMAIAFYFATAGLTSGLGAAQSMVVLLVWVYYSAQIFLLGAEFTCVYSYSRGSHAGDAPVAAPGVPQRHVSSVAKQVP